LYGQSTFPLGFEYYFGGVIKTEASTSTRETSLMVDNWDWRERHGQNWVTPVTNQGGCGSCWAFAATGATEALVNLYFNQILNLDLAEQDVLSCSGAGDCGGGYPYIALNYITSTGVVDEGAFPYTATDQNCSNKGDNPTELIKIGGRIDFGSGAWPKTEDNLKSMIIEKGPISGGLYDWSHAMVLPGYMVVEEGDHFYYRDLNLARYWKTVVAGDPLIGTTVWIFKNSWGAGWGDNGYVYVETPITNIGWTHALLTPVQSLVQTYEVVCVDSDGDGYYWWGLGEKPAGCGGPEEADGDDSDPTLGPLDEYGYCIVLGGDPVANFTADNTIINEGETVSFTDLSTYATSWSWSFEEGNPSTSIEQNPTITYNLQGSYNVILTVSNNGNSDTKEIIDYITVNEFIPTYCESHGNASAEWIESVQIGNETKISGSSGTLGYDDFTNLTIFDFESGQTYDIILEPGFNPRNKFEYWSVWIDFNGNLDFTDAGEQVFTASKKRSTVYGTISIPDGISTDTRMRISMSRNGIPSPCDIFDAGEVEDYTIQIGEAVPQPPVADFIADKTVVLVGGNVSFTDLSTNQPLIWLWDFEGGIADNSAIPNPTVTYNTLGEFHVTLTATNNTGSDEEIKLTYIKVVNEPPPPVYCSSSSNSNALEWISQVDIESFSNSSGASFYSDYSDDPAMMINLTPESSNHVTLTPHYTDKDQREFWRIWIDYNGDGDFDDSDEQVFVANNKKSAVSGTIIIPSNASGQTRMRISMKNGSAPSFCESFTGGGEVEDYTVDFGSGSSGLVIENDFDLNIFPNPASNVLNIHVISNNETVNIKVYNSLGRIIDDFNVESRDTQIDLSNYSKGIYYIGANDGIQNTFKKFVKN
ncbi:MAG: PKD domain-containing protein, partial [Bacteroidales bacterium]|nr:PKD domain-containing protein [Bacteroidales bacterium]